MGNQILFGALSALSLGAADFLAGVNSRSVGYARVLLVVFLVSCIGLSAYALIAGQSASVDIPSQWLIVMFGIMNTIAMLFIYRALALGPISIAAPIIAAHPAIVVTIALILGSRPSGGQWAGMVLTLLGAIVVAKVATVPGASDRQTGHGQTGHRKTVLIATCACVTYAIMVVSGQHSVPVHGALQTIWLGRIVAFVSLACLFLVTGNSPVAPAKYWPALCVQGVLDFAGVLFLLLGSTGELSEITAVVSSLFGGVTVLLARVFLKEHISAVQWSGVALILCGVSCLAYFV